MRSRVSGPLLADRRCPGAPPSPVPGGRRRHRPAGLSSAGHLAPADASVHDIHLYAYHPAAVAFLFPKALSCTRTRPVVVYMRPDSRVDHQSPRAVGVQVHSCGRSVYRFLTRLTTDLPFDRRLSECSQ